MGDTAHQNRTTEPGLTGMIEFAVDTAPKAHAWALERWAAWRSRSQRHRSVLPAVIGMSVIGIAILAASSSAHADGGIRPLYRPGPQPMQSAFGQASVNSPIRYDNASLARYITDLAFQLERGKPRQRLAKWQTPLTVSLAWPGSEAYRVDLQSLLKRLMRLSGVDISVAAASTRADTTDERRSG